MTEGTPTKRDKFDRRRLFRRAGWIGTAAVGVVATTARPAAASGEVTTENLDELVATLVEDVDSDTTAALSAAVADSIDGTVGSEKAPQEAVDGRARTVAVPRENLRSISLLDFLPEDFEGGDDASAAFQAAIDSFVTDSATGVVEVPPGDWYATFVLRSGVIVQGAGVWKTNIYPPAGSTADAIVTVGAGWTRNAGIRDLKIRGGGTADMWGIQFYAQPADAEPGTTGGIERCEFINLSVDGFLKGQIWLRGGGVNSLTPIQHLAFINVNAQRPAGANGPTLWITGQVNQTRFIGGNADGDTGITATPNVLIQREVNADGTNKSGKSPHSLYFGQGFSVQNSAQGATIESASSVTFDTCHFENLDYGVLASLSASGIRVARCHFANAASNGASGGYVVQASSSFVTVGDNEILGTVDRTYVRSGTSSGIRHEGRTSAPAGALTSGLTVTRSVGGGGTLDLNGAATAAVNASATAIATLTAEGQPGDCVYLRANGGTIQLASGGNIGLGGRTSPVTVASGGVAQLVRMDSGSSWHLVTVSA